ncbi:MAG: UTP--glucose-1-phosphate uridylyltransferase [Sandaracinaceae bacterium]|nr:UTP--glucose-1-phosphate uridylyltransferase [Sandaracinaceae bacterium]
MTSGTFPADRDVDDESRALLQRYGFDAPTFARLRARLKAGSAGPESNRIRGEVTPPEPGDVRDLPGLETERRDRLHALGRAAIAAGKVGVVTLAGGMATRFGGVVKAAVEALDGHSFLDLKLLDVQRLAERLDARIPVYLMTSFATDAEIARLAAQRSTERVPVKTFPQYISLRLTPDGELFHGDDGRVSCYAPGHGDLPYALRRAGALKQFRNGGGELLYMSNVDNLGATLDPAVIGFHLDAGVAVTAEVVDKLPGDKGGAPARVDGDLQIVESFRFPEHFDQDGISVFNTNSFVLDAGELDHDFPLTWFAVNKGVDGRDAVQFERLVGQITAFLPTAFLRVERSGRDGRFQPAKDPEELAQRRPEIRELLRARGVL